MNVGGGQTVSIQRRDGGKRRWSTAPHLFRVVEGLRPLAAPARHRLLGLDEINIGRAEPSTERENTGGKRRLRLGVQDSSMSSSHSTLQRERAHWTIQDCDSKNGTWVNGVRKNTAILLDGDVIELGHTFFVFRDRQPFGVDDPADTVIDRDDGPPGCVTLLPEIAHQLDELRSVAASKTPVLIRGATGTGKELLARAVHGESGRSGDFVAVNCAALPETLMERELFGAVRGAYSGAERDEPGLLAAADGGTLFLDEIGDLPLAAQAKLLRALQEQEVRPVGATASVSIDLRVLAATHRDVEEMVARHEFRDDLLARLCGLVIELRPLAERREDLGLLIAALLPRLAGDQASNVTFESETLRALLRYSWPRNVRELEKCLERALAIADPWVLGPTHLPEHIRRAATAPPPQPAALSDEDQRRRDELVERLASHSGNISAVAREMGKARTQIQRWLKRYGIRPDEYAR